VRALARCHWLFHRPCLACRIWSRNFSTGYTGCGLPKMLVCSQSSSITIFLPFKAIMNVPKLAFFCFFLERNQSPICDGLSLH
jgi:hypothetical protein